MHDQYANVLIVDDDEQLLEFLSQHLLGEGYKITAVTDGNRAYELIDSDAPAFSAVVSDVNMPEMNGYELCRKVREEYTGDYIPFVFVSALNTLEEKLEGYAAGGDDYVTKPVEPAELIQRVKQVINKQSLHQNLNQQLKETQQTAFQAMTYTSHLGQILRFVQESMDGNTLEDITRLIFGVTESLMLNCVIQFNTPNGVVDFSSGGAVNPLESNVIEMAKAKGRFFDFSHRTIINHDDFSLLIKNMPLDNDEQYGILKDVLGNFCNAIEIRTRLLFVNDKALKKDHAIGTVNKALANVDAALKQIQHENVDALDDMMHDLNDAMLTLGLTEAQEESLREIVKNYQQRTDEVFAKGLSINEQFETILETFKSELR